MGISDSEYDLFHRADSAGSRSLRWFLHSLVESVHQQSAIQFPESRTTRCRGGVGQHWPTDPRLRRAVPDLRRPMGTGAGPSGNVDALAFATSTPAEQIRHSGTQFGRSVHRLDRVATGRAYRWHHHFSKGATSHLLARRNGQRAFVWHWRERTSPSL